MRVACHLHEVSATPPMWHDGCKESWQPPQSGSDQPGSGSKIMLSNDIRNIATSIIGAILLSTAFVGAAVAPARALEIAPAQTVEAPLSQEILAWLVLWLTGVDNETKGILKPMGLF